MFSLYSFALECSFTCRRCEEYNYIDQCWFEPHSFGWWKLNTSILNSHAFSYGCILVLGDSLNSQPSGGGRQGRPPYGPPWSFIGNSMLAGIPDMSAIHLLQSWRSRSSLLWQSEWFTHYSSGVSNSRAFHLLWYPLPKFVTPWALRVTVGWRK